MVTIGDTFFFVKDFNSRFQKFLGTLQILQRSSLLLKMVPQTK